MVLSKDFKKFLETELQDSKSTWIASAMISKSGWNFLQSNIPSTTNQHYLIGIDLSTEPMVFKLLLNRVDIHARIYECAYTFHPKVYIIQKNNNELIAFIGSSNTTAGGLENNVEMNFQINDQIECKTLIKWFDQLYDNGQIISEEFLEEYKTSFAKSSRKGKQIRKEIGSIKNDLLINKGQFFSRNQHLIFNKKYYWIDNNEIRTLRKSVRARFLELHESIYPQFTNYGLNDLHCHHQSREIVSRHYFNQYSGNYINAMWLHYGKSFTQLQRYKNNEERSFINNIRLQVIIHEHSIGIWLVLGRKFHGETDRHYFRKQMGNEIIRKKFFRAFKALGDSYCINIPNSPSISSIKTPEELMNITNKETLENYFIIETEIDWLDKSLETNNISKTVLKEFQKLYPLYEIMRHKYS